MGSDSLDLTGIYLLIERSEARRALDRVEHVKSAIIRDQNLVVKGIPNQGVLVGVNSAVGCQKAPRMSKAAGRFVKPHAAEEHRRGVGRRDQHRLIVKRLREVVG